MWSKRLVVVDESIKKINLENVGSIHGTHAPKQHRINRDIM